VEKREDIVQKFSTFLSLGDYYNQRKPIWQADPELERYIKRLAQSEPEANEEFWAQHFLRIVKGIAQPESNQIQQRNKQTKNRHFASQVNHTVTGTLQHLQASGHIIVTSTKQYLDSHEHTQGCKRQCSTQTRVFPSMSSAIAERHLLAYLQEACLWAAQKRYQKFKFLRHKYSLAEYFQIANSAVNPPAKLFKNFNLNHSQTNIEGYAKTAIIRFIKNTIYSQDVEAKREKFSDYGLLKDLSNKELKEALVLKGFNKNQIDLYCLAWKCFDAIFHSNHSQGSRTLEPPNQKQLKQITDYYNQQLSKLNLPTPPVSEEKIHEILEVCIQATRFYRTKRFFPLEDYTNISDPMPTLLDTAIQSEEWEQVREVVSTLFTAMPETGQILLKLWQGLNLTQTEIATVFKNNYPELQKQYQVARYLGKSTKNLLKEFAQEWSAIHPSVSLNDEKDIDRIKEALMECLQSHCQRLLFSILDKVATKQSSANVIYLSSIKKLKQETEITTNRLNFYLLKTYYRHSDKKRYLIKTFIFELEKSMYFAQDSLRLFASKIEDFVDEWLNKL
jgi:hypothetical protein